MFNIQINILYRMDVHVYGNILVSKGHTGWTDKMMERQNDESATSLHRQLAMTLLSLFIHAVSQKSFNTLSWEKDEGLDLKLVIEPHYNKSMKNYPACKELRNYSKTCVKRSHKNRQNKDLNDKW